MNELFKLVSSDNFKHLFSEILQSGLKMANEDTFCLIGYNFEPKYNIHKLEEIVDACGLEDYSRIMVWLW